MKKLILSAVAAAALAGSAYTLTAIAATDAPDAARHGDVTIGRTAASCSTPSSPA